MPIIVRFLRSSSYNTWDFCPHKYFLDYTLGFHSPANKKAEKGTIVHKALELLARKKLALQKGETNFIDDEVAIGGAPFRIEDIEPDYCVQLAYSHFVEKSTFQWEPSDYKDCVKWLIKALEYNNGMFHPYNQDIIEPEKYFDIEIDEAWAHYQYKLPDGKILEGNLGLKGTLDLIVKIDDNTYELVDYKTGRRYDWNSGEEKTYDKLQVDPQLRIYHYALSKLYPEIEHFMVSIFYINDGGCIPLCFSKDDLEETEYMIRKRFEQIRNTVKPNLIYPHWKCTKLCHFFKNTIDNKPAASYDDSACKQISDDLVNLGMSKVLKKYAKSDFDSYGGGGGRSDAR